MPKCNLGLAELSLATKVLSANPEVQAQFQKVGEKGGTFRSYPVTLEQEVQNEKSNRKLGACKQLQFGTVYVRKM